MSVSTSSPVIAASLGIARTECVGSESLFVVNVTELLGTCEYLDLINDVVRMVTIYSVAFYLTSKEPSGFGEVVLLIALGVAAYWLVVHKLVRFV